MNTAGNKEISCSFGSGTDKNRGFNLDEAVLVEIVTGNLTNLVAHDNVALKVGTTKVKIAVFKSCQLGSLAILNDFKRRSLAVAKNTKIIDINLNFTCRYLHVL